MSWNLPTRSAQVGLWHWQQRVYTLLSQSQDNAFFTFSITYEYSAPPHCAGTFLCSQRIPRGSTRAYSFDCVANQDIKRPHWTPYSLLPFHLLVSLSIKLVFLPLYPSCLLTLFALVQNFSLSFNSSGLPYYTLMISLSPTCCQVGGTIYCLRNYVRRQVFSYFCKQRKLECHLSSYSSWRSYRVQHVYYVLYF